MNPIQV